MLCLLLAMLATAGPVEDAEAVLSGHARGRSVQPLEQAVSRLTAAQAADEAPNDGPTWDLMASIHLAIAQDGPPTGKNTALGHAVDAASKAHERGGSPTLDDTVATIALVLTDSLRRARTPEARAGVQPLGVRLDALCAALTEPPPATVCGQLAQALAPVVLADDAVAAGALANRAARLGHPSKSVDLRVSEAMTAEAEPAAALAFVESAVARWPTTWELRDFAGGLQARLKRYEPAVAHFDEAIEQIHPELTRQRAILHRKRAAALAPLSRLAEAIADYEAAEALTPADPTQRYLWARAHVMSAQGITAEVRKRTGNKAALPARAQTHCNAAIPLLESVKGDARLGGPSVQALALCEQVVAAEATGE